MFVATLYTSDSEKIMRYTDEVSRRRFDYIGGRISNCLGGFLSACLPLFPIGRDPGALSVDGRPQRPAQLPAAREHAAAERVLHRYARPRARCWSGRMLTSMHLSEFELGLELDSAEVRGVLIFEGQDWGHVVFDFRT